MKKEGLKRVKLSPKEEAEFVNWMNTDPKVLSWKKQMNKPKDWVPDLDDKKEMFDYRAAWKSNDNPVDINKHTKQYHWSGPKDKSHPTYWKSLFSEEFGYDPDDKGLSFDEAVKKMPSLKKYRPKMSPTDLLYDY